MGVKFLHDFIEANTSEEEIDLIKIASTYIKNLPHVQKKPGVTQKFCLVIDGESCLNRLYGGYYSDWVCGGQWNRMANFIKDLVTKLNESYIEIVVFFNGAIEPQRMNEWIASQKEEYIKIQKILAVIKNKRAPPPKAFWTAPAGLRMSIKMMLRQMNVNVVSTIDDHRQEVIAYCRENNVHGLIADDAEYIAFDPPRLFSASHLKLTYRGSLLTREYVVSKLMKMLDLNNEKLCVLAALLGNYLLSDKDLKDVYEKLQIQMDNSEEYKPEKVIKTLSQYLNEINISTNLDDVVQKIFGTDQDPRGPVLKQSIQYYLNGTKDGFLKYRSVSSGKRGKISDKPQENVDTLQEPDLDTTALASEKAGADTNILNAYKEASECLNSEQEETKLSNSEAADNSVNNFESKSSKEFCVGDKKQKNKKEKPAPVLPQVSHEVMRTLSERHSKGLMSPHIYQILSQGEVKLPVVLENEMEIPNIYSFYKPIRQMVYAIVFNLHHHNFLAAKENKPIDVDIRIKEWVFNKTEKMHKSEYVKAESVGWRVPTIQRLWFGTTQDDKRRRLRAFLTCMRSDVQLILNPEFVPQQLLVAAVVLRYIMSFPETKILRKQELDAFIVTALAPEFPNAQYTQELRDPISSRSVQLAALFMKGVEMALLVNDACGAPVPWLMCCPWLFFDGKLFNHMFDKASTCKTLQELCGNRLGLCLRAERMRLAILEGLDIQFARPPMPLQIPADQLNHPRRHPGFMNTSHRAPPNSQISSPNINRSSSGETNRGRRALGGRLKVAGVVVGSWGASHSISQQNYDTAQPYLLGSSQVSSLTGSYNNYGYRSRSNFTWETKGKSFKSPYGKKKPVKKEKKYGAGRGMTVAASSRNLLASKLFSAKTKRNDGEITSNTNDSNLLNGSDTTTSNERFDNSTVNGAVGFMGEGDGSSSLKIVCETATIVEAVNK